MLDKIKARIKSKYPDVNLSTKRLDAIADRLSKKVTDENEIDAQLDVFNELMPFADIAKQDDKVRDLAQKAKATTTQTANTTPKTEDTKTETSKVDLKKDEPKEDEIPVWAKTLLEQHKTVTAELNAIKAEKQQTSIKQQIKAKLTGVPELYWSEFQLPQSEDAIEAFTAKVEQIWTQSRVTDTTKPPTAGGITKSKPSDSEVKAILDKIY